ncbi:MAG: hypothetical protein EF806_04540 [Candidatus Methanoliparum thermophilum]|uniref:Uncharacterized protein n=1 Tax=Methanoliparum thermophilum TaxID=2491083 RepID=A0A520KSL9_METT2|nr:hypothetical protein [Candidatus Methanoliparum sp. LAM-1]RZN64603.1 MAG: hypothetical protein EF806_04540 [Candidatus Methanoliparum thermophilum]BDC35775.1 hypothetical protein MTLP_04570 [Candidatus Methanoliparum sp. LAM-1]
MIFAKEDINTPIPAMIKKIKKTNGYTTEIVFSLQDVMNNKQLLIIKEEVINEFNKLLRKIKNIVGTNIPSKIPRKKIWEIGHTILEERKKIGKKYGVDITNIIQAVAEEIGLSKSSIQYMVQFSAMLPKNKVREEISWGKYQEAIQLINKTDFNQCITLIEKGELKTTKEIRNYVRQKNNERRTK